MNLQHACCSLLSDGLIPFGSFALGTFAVSFRRSGLTLGKENVLEFILLPFLFFLTVLRAAQVNVRTLSFRETLRAVSLFSFETSTFPVFFFTAAPWAVLSSLLASKFLTLPLISPNQSHQPKSSRARRDKSLNKLRF